MDEVTWESENGLTYTEVARQEYGGNNCVFSAGFVEGESKPEVDTVYLRLEKDGVGPTTLLLRPDEMQSIAWLCSGTVWSHLMNEKHEREDWQRQKKDAGESSGETEKDNGGQVRE
jgi:hypothetical protein